MDDFPEKPTGRGDIPAKKRRTMKNARKIASNSSDKAARRNVPLRKAMANRKLRRLDKQALAQDAEQADAVRDAETRKKWQSWGSDALEPRLAARAAEREFLDTTSKADRASGRRGAQEMVIARFKEQNFGVKK